MSILDPSFLEVYTQPPARCAASQPALIGSQFLRQQNGVTFAGIEVSQIRAGRSARPANLQPDWWLAIHVGQSMSAPRPERAAF
jgi:hypothetical protein